MISRYFRRRGAAPLREDILTLGDPRIALNATLPFWHHGMMARWGMIFIVSIGCASAKDEDAPRRQCERLRDHVIDLRLRSAQAVDKAAHRKVLGKALGEDFISSCLTLPEERVRCALEARSSSAVAACQTAVSRR